MLLKKDMDGEPVSNMPAQEKWQREHAAVNFQQQELQDSKKEPRETRLTDGIIKGNHR